MSRREDWNYGQREAKIIANKDGAKCLMWEELQGWEWELGSKVRNQGDQQRDGARYEERARLWVMTKAVNYERVWTVAWDRPVLKNSASGPKKL